MEVVHALHREVAVSKAEGRLWKFFNYLAISSFKILIGSNNYNDKDVWGRWYNKFYVSYVKLLLVALILYID